MLAETHKHPGFKGCSQIREWLSQSFAQVCVCVHTHTQYVCIRGRIINDYARCMTHTLWTRERRTTPSSITFHHNTILHLVIYLRLPGLSTDEVVGQVVGDDSVPGGLSAADHRS